MRSNNKVKNKCHSTCGYFKRTIHRNMVNTTMCIDFHHSKRCIKLRTSITRYTANINAGRTVPYTNDMRKLIFAYIYINLSRMRNIHSQANKIINFLSVDNLNDEHTICTNPLKVQFLLSIYVPLTV